jgi:hypothetical protein
MRFTLIRSNGANYKSMRSRAPFKRALAVAGIVVLSSLAPFSTFVTHSQNSTPDYKNANLAVDARVADLLKRMTIEEKVAQLTCLWQQRPEMKPAGDLANDRGELSPEKAAQVMKYGIGQIARQRERKGPREGAAFANSVQKWLLEKHDSESRQCFTTRFFTAIWPRAAQASHNPSRSQVVGIWI